MSPSPNVCNYNDLYEYLRDYYFYRKNQDPIFNYEIWSAELGYRSNSYLKMIVAKSRKPTQDLFQKFSAKENFNTKEQKHFISLMMKIRSASDLEAAQIQDQICNSLNIQDEEAIAQESAEKFLANFNGPLLRLLQSYKDIEFSNDQLCQIMKVSPAELDELFEGLEQAEMQQQPLRGKSFIVNTNRGQDALKQYHLQNLKEAEEKILTEPETANFQTLYFSMNESRRPEMIEEVNEFLNRMKLKYGDNKVLLNKIFKLNLNVYPVTAEITEDLSSTSS